MTSTLFNSLFSYTHPLYLYIWLPGASFTSNGHDMHWDKVGLFLIRTEGPLTFMGLVTENSENNIKVPSNKFIRNEVTIS